MIVKLVVQGGKNAGTVIAINKPRYVIGRSPECNLRLETKALSRQHAEICVKDGAVTVKDLGSTNGTYVDGVKISNEVELKNGQKLRIGPLETIVQISAEMHGSKNPKVTSVKEAVTRVAQQKKAQDDDELDLSELFGEDGDDAGERFQEGLTTVANMEIQQEKLEQKQREGVNKSKDSRDAASKVLEAIFKNSMK